MFSLFSVLTLREIEIETGLIHGVDGSCHFTQGDTSVLVSILGPSIVQAHEEDYQKAILKVKIEKDFGQGGNLKRSHIFVFFNRHKYTSLFF